MLVANARFLDWLSISNKESFSLRDLLEADRYEQVAERLERTTQLPKDDVDVFTQLVFVLRHTCLALALCQQEVEWHQSVLENAAARQTNLRAALVAVLELADDILETPAMLHEERVTSFSLPKSIKQIPGKVPGKQPRKLPSVRRWFQPNAAHDVLDISASAASSSRTATGADMVVYALGTFEVYLGGVKIEQWGGRKTQSLFKYLLTNQELPIHKELLMETFWEHTEPELSRNRLNVTIYALRQVLQNNHSNSHTVLYEDEHYLLNPALSIWTDYETFTYHCQTGHHCERTGDLKDSIRHYENAILLYNGDFMSGDPYEEWLAPQRTALQMAYLSALDKLSKHYLNIGDWAACVSMCNKILTSEPAHEEAHRRLMTVYSRQHQPYLAIRQYHLCLQALENEDAGMPAQTTLNLLDRIHKGEIA